MKPASSFFRWGLAARAYVVNLNGITHQTFVKYKLFLSIQNYGSIASIIVTYFIE